jgi:iron only hydrogenase large subunit-like protein
MEHENQRDIDAVLTTREVAKMIKQAGIDFNQLKDEGFDHPLGEYTGAGVIFGATGGVMEAALRTVSEVLENKELNDIEFNAVRGVEAIKEATLNLAGMEINIAVVHGGKNAKKLMEMIKSGEKNYHFVEVMGCSGGCVNGGGQPHVSAKIRNTGLDIRTTRAKALYEEDVKMPIRKSHLNPDIKTLYKEFLGEPNGHKSHELLHTHYKMKEIFPIK